MAALGLCCCMSYCLVGVHRPFIAVAPLVEEHRLSYPTACSILPGGFLTAGPPGKSWKCNPDALSAGCHPQQDSPCFRCLWKFRCPQANHPSDQLATNLERGSPAPSDLTVCWCDSQNSEKSYTEDCCFIWTQAGPVQQGDTWDPMWEGPGPALAPWSQEQSAFLPPSPHIHASPNQGSQPHLELWCSRCLVRFHCAG